jgi:hypothetical protein
MRGVVVDQDYHSAQKPPSSNGLPMLTKWLATFQLGVVFGGHLGHACRAVNEHPRLPPNRNGALHRKGNSRCLALPART